VISAVPFFNLTAAARNSVRQAMQGADSPSGGNKMQPYLPWITLFLGIISRILVPFLLKRRQDPLAPWDWRYVYGQLITVMVVCLVLPFTIPDLVAITNMAPVEAYITGWFVADLGREADKYLSSLLPSG
jgi:hypothetical protein